MTNPNGWSAIIAGIGFGAIYFVYLAVGLVLDSFSQIGAL